MKKYEEPKCYQMACHLTGTVRYFNAGDPAEAQEMARKGQERLAKLLLEQDCEVTYVGRKDLLKP